MTDFVEGTPPTSQRTAEIESDIRRTRDRMGHEIEAIGDKFRPERITQRAKDAVSRKGANVFRTAKENPLPAAIVALGLTLLFRARAKENDRDMEGNGHGFTDKTRELAGNAKEKVQEKAKRTGNKLQEFFESNPLIAGAGVVVLGAAVGALIPETEKEKRLMGNARDEIVEKAKGVAQHAQGAFEQTMSERATR